MPNDPNEEGREGSGAEDDPECRLRQIAARRSFGQLAGDEFEIAFDQSEIGGSAADTKPFREGRSSSCEAFPLRHQPRPSPAMLRLCDNLRK
jgi:hypothetical protein